MSDTPETDAAVIAAGGDWSPVLRAVSQRLERQRDEALMDHANGDIATMTRNHYERILRERDEARERCAKLQDIAERAVNLGLGSQGFSLSETFQRIADTLKRWRSTQPCKK
jgi:predicted component of type VI protein secretion system